MAWIHPKVSRRLAVAGVLGLVAAGGAVRAQDHTPDPYKPYNSVYDTYVYPQYPNGNSYVPNLGVLEGQTGFRGVNRFQEFLDEGDPGDSLGSVRRRTGPGVPYYSAYRRLDRDYNRVYQPNANADRGYYEEQQARQEKYLQYLRERDPQKRAQLYREYVQGNYRNSRNIDARSAPGRADSPAEAPRRSSAPGLGSGRGDSAGGTASEASALRAHSGLYSSSTARGGLPSEVLRRSESMGRSGSTAPGLGSGTTRSRMPGLGTGTGRSTAPGLNSGTGRSRAPGLDR